MLSGLFSDADNFLLLMTVVTAVSRCSLAAVQGDLRLHLYDVTQA